MAMHIARRGFAVVVGGLACLLVMSASRLQAATVQQEGVTEPEWAPDGRRLVFAGGVWPDLDVQVLDTGSGEATRVFHSDSTDYQPSWSPDGQRLVFVSTRTGRHGLYVGILGRGKVRRLAVDSTCENVEPRWAPTGGWIAFRSDCDGNREVYRIRPDGSERRRLTHAPLEDSEPAWSPDGHRLLFTSYRDGQPDVYVMNADGTGVRRLTETPGGHSRRAEWSPDGQWVAFGSDREGDEEVYVMHLDGSGLRNVTNHPAREYYSRWAPDGRHLVFTSNREPKQYGDRSVANAIYSVAMDGTELRRLYPK